MIYGANGLSSSRLDIVLKTEYENDGVRSCPICRTQRKDKADSTHLATDEISSASFRSRFVLNQCKA